MITKTLRMLIAVSVAVATSIVYSVPADAFSDAKYVSNLSARAVIPQGDDDDDGLSGGALAVLLLAIGGAVAGVLYVSVHPQGGPEQTVAFDKIGGQTVKVTIDNTDRDGKHTRSQWLGRIDGRTFAVTMNGTGREGKPVRVDWKGNVDGRFYPVTGDRTSEEWSYSKINARTLGFTERKAGRLTLTGQVDVSADGRSFTITSNGIDSKGRRVKSQVAYQMR